MIRFIWISIAAVLLSACWDNHPDQEAKENAEKITDAMRDIRDSTNASGDNRLSNRQIDDYEKKAALMLDKDNQKSAMCSTHVM